MTRFKYLNAVDNLLLKLDSTIDIVVSLVKSTGLFTTEEVELVETSRMLPEKV